ncbi:MAG: hypothetical protein HOJ25_02360 [Candidatus Magasanikbacteria bacterium]|nr:hypothetical protein [Candidatus Magasanikbacteria bacterium]MBT6294510.1 hypothetical protein [Candidatus Magasanikbacteria bacterium]
MRILFSGGGTLGSVTPLLGMYDAIKKHKSGASFFWIGTKRGPERAFLKHSVNIPFFSIRGAKFRRYISIKNVWDIGYFIIGFFRSLILLRKIRPDICISAGGFVSVPVHLAAKCLGIPTWIHQQDIEIGLANKIMAPLAKTITVSVNVLCNSFPKKKALHLGNPVRDVVYSGKKSRAKNVFDVHTTLPVVLVVGGGTGAVALNMLMCAALPQLAQEYEIIHVYGKEKEPENLAVLKKTYTTYHPYAFLAEEMSHAYALADIVVFRGGLGTLTEIAALKKPAICVPKPGHQEKNATFFRTCNAVRVVGEKASPADLQKTIEALVETKSKTKEMITSLAITLPIPKSQEIFDVLTRTISK